jgi:hypothetical protein
VNNLVPSQQLKQDIFKKYVSVATVRVNPSLANVNPLDIDALPKYA